MDSGIWELDLHGMNICQARAAVDAALRRAKGGTYRIRVIHGFSRGTALRDMVRREYARHPKVLRLEIGLNPGEADLVLREF